MTTSHRRTSLVLQKILDESTEDTISVGRFTTLLGERAFALVILIFSLPNSLPIPGIPGFSTITGIPILFIALQMMLGRDTIWLPKKIADKEFSQAMLQKVLRKALPIVMWLEKFLKPRWSWCLSNAGERLIGTIIFIMAAILSLPIVGGNFLPGFCISLLALAILERDGAFAFFASLFTIGSIVFMYKIVVLAFHLIVEGVSDLIDWANHLFDA